MSKSIQFIVRDVERSRRSFLKSVTLGALLVLSIVAVGLGLRRDYVDAFSTRNLLPPGVMIALLWALLFLFADKKNRSEKLRVRASLILMTTALILSLTQPHTETSLMKFTPQASFWPEAAHCIGVGFLASALASLIIGFGAFFFWPSPNRRWRIVLAGLASLSGVAALTLHCMGPLYSHTFVAHWGQAILFFPLSFLLQSILFRIAIQPILSDRTNIKNLSRL